MHPDGPLSPALSPQAERGRSWGFRLGSAAITEGPEETEGRAGVTRVEAYSDARDRDRRHDHGARDARARSARLGHLLHLWPVFVAYALSFAYVSIYWVNHHRLFHHATRVTNGLLWSNIALIFTLSLIPFGTAYLGEQIFSRDATLVYMGVMLLPSIAYMWLQRTVRRTGSQSDESQAYHRLALRKGAAASASTPRASR
jgi:hypothetical protein